MGMKDFSYYNEVAIKYPNKSDFTMYYVYKSGEKLFEGALTELNEFVKNQGIVSEGFLAHAFQLAGFLAHALQRAGYTVESELDEMTFKLARKAYGEAVAAKGQEFYQDLLDEFGVADSPKAAKAYSLAWGYGHSSGYSEVHNYFSDLVELIK